MTSLPNSKRSRGGRVMNRMMLSTAVAVALAGLLAAGADAHLRDGSDRAWVFEPDAYQTRSQDRQQRGASLPLQIVFRGGGVPVTVANVNTRLVNAWPPVGARQGWERRSNPRCQARRYAGFIGPAPGRLLRWDPMIFTGSNDRRCRDQIHARFYSDRQHATLYSSNLSHPGRTDFMLANFHKERYPHKRRGNSPSEPLQQTRRRVLRRVSSGAGTDYCVDFHIGIHPFAQPKYAKRDYDGIIGRISMAEKPASGAC